MQFANFVFMSKLGSLFSLQVGKASVVRPVASVQLLDCVETADQGFVETKRCRGQHTSNGKIIPKDTPQDSISLPYLYTHFIIAELQ